VDGLPAKAEIVRLAARGDGVTADGRYVPLTAPGDLVRFGPGSAEVVPGPRHAVPPCRHFPECGGCQLQHIDDATYAAWAIERILAALDAAGVRVGAVSPVHVSPPRSRRRAALKAVRAGSGIAIGFHAAGTHRVVDMAECHVLRPELFALIAPIRITLLPLLPPGQGAGVTLTLTASGVDVLLANIRAERAADRTALAAFAESVDLARLSIEHEGGLETVALRRAPVVAMGGVQVELPPAAFLQATEDGETALVAAALDALAPARRVADLFSGVGTFALPLAAAGKRVAAADASGPALAALARAGGGRVETLHCDLFRRPLRADELKRFDAALFDPPRAGAKEQAAELARSALARVVAVSCNPATFARDAAILTAAGFALQRLWPVAQFRWSNHLELAALFTR
jgi:23S rRNA (uracil1939-C5)-methyltransferase